MPADCDSDTLDTTSGTANLRADFDANTIDLRWYNNNTLLNVTSTSNTCTYDTTISLPTNPTKKGYTFKGWKVRPEYDFSTLDVDTDAYTGYGRGIKDGKDFCFFEDLDGWHESDELCKTNNEFDDLNSYEWKTPFSYGTIYGMALCSVTPGNPYNAGAPNETEHGKYCWCKVTGYKPTNSSIKYSPLHNTIWASRHEYDSLSDCIKYCPNCAGNLRTMRSLRQSLFR